MSLNSNFSKALCYTKSNTESSKEETVFNVLLSFHSFGLSGWLTSMHVMCCLHQ